MPDFLEKADEHSALTQLIPWYVNGTLTASERRRLERHLESCFACREDLALERETADAMTGAPSVEYLPAPSLKRLNERLDLLAGAPAAQPGAAAAGRPDEARPGRTDKTRPVSIGQLIAASIAVLVAALGLLIAAQRPGLSKGAQYRTVTTSAPRAPEAVIRAVFAPNLSVGDLQRILDESGLRIVAGPTEAGVYSLAATRDQPVNAALASLRRNDAVRFAESIAPLPAAAEPGRGAPAPPPR